MSVNLTSDSESLSGWFHIQAGFVESPLLMPPAQDRSSLQQVFQTLNARSCPKSYNFHLHTRRSDGQLEPYEVMEQAIEIGLKGLTITDHHSTQGYKEAQKWLDHWKHKYPKRVNQAPRLWTGVEISARLLAVDVHILGYAFDPDSRGLQPYLQGGTTLGTDAYAAENVINAIHQAGGLAVLAHPARYRYPVPELIAQAARLGINGVEVYYCYRRHTNPWSPTAEIKNQVKQLADSYGLLNTCGTDTHGHDILLPL